MQKTSTTAVILASIITIFFAANAKAFSLRCDISTKWNCSKSGCKTATSTIHNLINFSTAKYSRCDEKGCDSYDMEVVQSGAFLNISLPKKSMLAKLGGNNLEHFTEVVTLGTGVLVSHGQCSKTN